MDIKNLLKMSVIDTAGQSVGKVENIEFNEDDGVITDIIVKLDNGLFSRDTEKINFDKVETIKDVVLLNTDIDLD
ncbi:PRC-barrel domain-containing protein [Methanobrevibacter sp. OttesenSCG-928-I08]|nr:PRC-barrel domain-containing protein [Methanobrevibacter sp. OttesenSCG-928-I08]